MYMKKTLVATAISATLGLGSMAAHAVSITTWQLGDVLAGGNSSTPSIGTDGRISDFNFGSVAPGNSTNMFGATGELCGANPCAAITLNGNPIGTNVFSTGFNFGGTGVFAPNVTAGGMLADITGTTLTFGALNFGGIFGNVQFFLAPNVLTNCTGQAGCGTSATMGYEAYAVPINATSWGVRVRYVGTINDPSSPFNGFQANWRLEGTMSSAPTQIPVPAAAYLLGSGLIGLAGVARRRRNKTA